MTSSIPEKGWFDPRATGNFSRLPLVRSILRFGFMCLISLSGLMAGCSAFTNCTLHFVDGRLVLDQCAGQDQKPIEGSDEKPANDDPEKPTG